MKLNTSASCALLTWVTGGSESIGRVCRWQRSIRRARTVHSRLTSTGATSRLYAGPRLCTSRMPGVDGYEVCRRIRAQSWGVRMLLIAQTGWGQEFNRARFPKKQAKQPTSSWPGVSIIGVCRQAGRFAESIVLANFGSLAI
jgi:CheY-like chemotaxis protein